MGIRTRAKAESSGTGYKYNLQGVLLGTVSNLGSYDSVTDYVADGDGHNFDVRHLTLRGCLINASSTGSITGRRLVNYQPDRMRNQNDSIYGHVVVTDRPSDAILAADLLARTNPSRPVVDLPIAFWELKDIPGLLKEEGGRISRKIATGILVNEFAIKPFISDVKALLNFTDEVNKREKELDRLYSQGLKRTRSLWTGSNTAGPIDSTVHSGDKIIVHLLAHKSTKLHVSGHVKWFPPKLKLMKGDMRAQARRAVLGLTVDFSTAWNAIPWSWLVDWCSNVGDILTANRNIIGATHGPVQLMDHTTTTCMCDFSNPPSVISRGSWTEETKRRRSISYIPVDVQLPVLNFRQLSILGSIGVTRRVPRHL